MSEPTERPDPVRPGQPEPPGLGQPSGPVFDAPRMPGPSGGPWGPPAGPGYPPTGPTGFVDPRAPQPPTGAPGRPGPLPPVSAHQFRPPSNTRPWIVSAIVVAVVVAAVIVGTVVAHLHDRIEQTDEPAVPPASTATPDPHGKDFDSDEGSGRMEFVASRWTSTRLLVEIELTCTDGSVSYGSEYVLAFDSSSNQVSSTTLDAPDPVMGDGVLHSGEDTTGWLAFDVTRQDMTIMLMNRYGQSVQAYKVDG